MMVESKVLLQCLEQLEIGNTKIPHYSTKSKKRKKRRLKKQLKQRHLKLDHIAILRRVKSIKYHHSQISKKCK